MENSNHSKMSQQHGKCHTSERYASILTLKSRLYQKPFIFAWVFDSYYTQRECPCKQSTCTFPMHATFSLLFMTKSCIYPRLSDCWMWAAQALGQPLFWSFTIPSYLEVVEMTIVKLPGLIFTAIKRLWIKKPFYCTILLSEDSTLLKCVEKLINQPNQNYFGRSKV